MVHSGNYCLIPRFTIHDYHSPLTITEGLIINFSWPSLIPATFGMFLIGIGVSPAVPLVFCAAGKILKQSPSVAIAAVSPIGFFGNLVGPPIIGYIAGMTSLKVSFLFLSLFGMLIALLAVKYQPPLKENMEVVKS